MFCLQERLEIGVHTLNESAIIPNKTRDFNHCFMRYEYSVLFTRSESSDALI